MKEINNKKSYSFVKKTFIKICRILGYEIIDQNNFTVPTQKKTLRENLSVAGIKSINLPLGEIKISRKVSSLTVLFRSCSSVNMLTQNKKRIFEKNKYEYSLRSLFSIIKSINNAIKFFPNVKFEVQVIDHKSEKKILDKMNELLKRLNCKYLIKSLNIEEFSGKIKKVNSINQNVTENQISNMSNIYQSLKIAKDECDDLIYFIEDDYLHSLDTIKEMLFSYERISSTTNNELFICPIDYPYLYKKLDSTRIFLGETRHWRIVEETLCSFLTSKQMIVKHWNKLTSMCEFEHYPFELPLHKIYLEEYCLSPIPSLAIHFTNINSIYGLSPNFDWEKVWKENEVL